ncbi:hypothetical protein [Actinoallomurus rhizosphaericola]|uniref:hypothetical protein n=1 Tax=Actinoallomurus rhizosphaericola TaxID=2952536 RepID=UPI002092DBD1|nr:hypothetical protein [Actinoallomurus rhizosphaericola]MCO5999824.1 hypothetical protein [Actinoallomurus rhizosphaericola]
MSDEGDGKLESRRRHEAAAGLWPIGRALTIAGIGAVVGLAVVTVVALAMLGFPRLGAHRALSVGDLLEMLKLVLGTVAGVGALVALVMNYRKQRLAEVSEVREQQRMLHERQRADDDRVRVFNERFAAAAGQLGHSEPEVRLAGAYAMAGLADDWADGRQTCIDVLCAYVRMPYEPDPSPDAPAAERLVFRRKQKIRHAIIAIITAHLRVDARVSWQGHDFDFTGARFDGGDFSHAQFTGGKVLFSEAEFVYGSRVTFFDTTFAGGKVFFDSARFASGAVVSFIDATFAGAEVFFVDVWFAPGEVCFTRATFANGMVTFTDAAFADGAVTFADARFVGGTVSFADANFGNGEIDLRYVASWEVPPVFPHVELTDPPAGLLLPPVATPSAKEA